MVLATGVLLFGSMERAQAQNHPEWCDQQSSKNAAERAVCANRSLWVLDDNLNVAYQEAQQRARADRARIQSSQRDWIRVTRNGCGGDVACLRAVYNRRIEVLEGIARRGHM
jgi:uncharacterized protein